MDIGIGLPAAVPGTAGSAVVEAARRAEALGFSSLGVLDRLVYPNYEPLTVLAAAAAVTSSIRLTTSVLVPTYRGSAVTLAKQVATLDQLCGGRLVLGLGAGGRPDDFDAAGAAFARRGTRLGEMVAEMRHTWAARTPGHPDIGPPPSGAGPSIMLGGRADATFDRVARYADGWIAAGGSATIFATFAERVRSAWRKRDRAGAPRLMSIGYFALGPDAEQIAQRYLLDYYAFLGPAAAMVAGSALTTTTAIRDEVDAFARTGCDELILFPCSSEPTQADQLADALL